MLFLLQDCNENKLIIYSDIASCGFGCIGADADCNQTITSYLTKASSTITKTMIYEKFFISPKSS